MKPSTLILLAGVAAAQAPSYYMDILNAIAKSGPALNGLVKFINPDKIEEWTMLALLYLKNSGLANSVIKASLTDDEVRKSLTEIVIQVLDANVIPYEEVLRAAKDSGFANDVTKFSLTDKETRKGLVELVVELTPQLAELGFVRGSEKKERFKDKIKDKFSSIKDKIWKSEEEYNEAAKALL